MRAFEKDVTKAKTEITKEDAGQTDRALLLEKAKKLEFK